MKLETFAVTICPNAVDLGTSARLLSPFQSHFGAHTLIHRLEGFLATLHKAKRLFGQAVPPSFGRISPRQNPAEISLDPHESTPETEFD